MNNITGKIHQSTFPVVMLLTLLSASYNTLAEQAPITICTDYHCDETQSVSLTPQQIQTLKSLFTDVLDATTEREQIRHAIAFMEVQVGKVTDTWRDLGMNPYQVSNEPGQLDCIAESINTTTYLNLLASNHLLQWHQVLKRQKRVAWVVNIHWTAVIQDSRSNIRYAVDSWFLDNGQLPYIQELKAWKQWHRFE